MASMRTHSITVIVAVLLFSVVSATSRQTPGGVAGDCQLCHVEDSWNELRTPVLFDHSGTAFPLTGQHRQAECRSCHTGNNYDQIHDFASAPTNCAGCHEDVHSGELGDLCSDCHTPERWVDPASMRQMHEQTRMPLVGVHADLDCQACHAAGSYAGLSAECISCHLKDFQSTRNPDHTATGFGTDCERCHGLVTATWDENTAGYKFIHPFPLTGGHDNRECSDCHLPGTDFADLSPECVACHEANYLATTEPNHVEAGFGTQCDVCHTVVRWSDAFFDHNATGFPLTGGHDGLECSNCHANGYIGLTGECSNCHLTDFENAVDPPHEMEGFGHDCTLCHTTSAWTPATFEHEAITGYALTGAHTDALCLDCHIDGQYTGTPSDCYGCHSTDFEGAQNPPHDPSSFGTQCLDCHTTTAWTPATFDHATVTGYALTGAHEGLACVDCHIDGQYTGTSSECIDCHAADFEGATDPPHDPLTFGTQCLDCHTTTAWTPATFDHFVVIGYALTGAHSSALCTDCHPGGQYTGTPSDCYGCHQQDYEGTTDPDHAAAGFPTTCEDCHSTTTWDDADFDHDSQWFPIYSGSHRGEWDSCSDCHPNSSAYSEFTCISCHEHNQADMDSEHDDVSNYVYQSSACYDCHPRGTAEDDTIVLPIKSRDVK